MKLMNLSDLVEGEKKEPTPVFTECLVSDGQWCDSSAHPDQFERVIVLDSRYFLTDNRVLFLAFDANMPGRTALYRGRLE